MEIENFTEHNNNSCYEYSNCEAQRSCCQTMNEKAREGKSSNDKNMLVFSCPEIISSIYFAIFLFCVCLQHEKWEEEAHETQVSRSWHKPRLLLLKDRIKSDDKERKSIIKSKQIELKNFLFLSSLTMRATSQSSQSHAHLFAGSFDLSTF